jgi:hypothetical protein
MSSDKDKILRVGGGQKRARLYERCQEKALAELVVLVFVTLRLVNPMQPCVDLATPSDSTNSECVAIACCMT